VPPRPLRLLAITGLFTSFLAIPAASQTHFQTIYTFGAYPDAQTPQGLAAGLDGALYGASAYGGLYGPGTIFEMQPPAAPGAAWTVSVLHSFAPQFGDGWGPNSSAVVGSGGAIFGTTTGPGYGTVYGAQPPASPGQPWTESVLMQGTGIATALNPNNVVAGPNGVVYGTDVGGGDYWRGSVFELAPPPLPGEAWTETLLYSFGAVDSNDGTGPVGLALAADGTLYGVTQSTVFQLVPPTAPSGAWTLNTIYSFSETSDGFTPTQAPVISGGAIYMGPPVTAAAPAMERSTSSLRQRTRMPRGISPSCITLRRLRTA